MTGLGHHGLSCAKSAGRNGRHMAINQLVRRALVSAGVPSVLEPPGLVLDDGRRPDGMTQVQFHLGKAMVWDVTVVDTMCPSSIGGSVTTAGYAAAEAEKRKNRKYRELTDRFHFVPLAFETFGPWSEEGKRLISSIGRKLTEKTGEKRSPEFLRQRISIEIQRGNALSVFSTHEHSRDLGEVFYILKSKH